MAMMRRGPLAEYPVDWVLRQAAIHRVTGSIEFNSICPMTVYLHGGSVYHAIAAVVPSDGQAPVHSRAASEPSAREQVADVLAGSLTTSDGWYYHDPLGRHEGHGPWQWPVEVLLTSARTMALLDESLGPWAQVELDLRTTPDDRISLGADAWAVVVELATQVNTRAIRNRLDWDPGRLVVALDELARTGAVASAVGEPAVAPPIGGDNHLDAHLGNVSLPASRSAHPPGPVPAAKEETGDRRGALRRLIATLRPT